MSFRERNKDFRLSYDNRYTQPRIGTELRNLTLLEYTGSLYLSGNSGINGTLYVRDNIGINTTFPSSRLDVRSSYAQILTNDATNNNNSLALRLGSDRTDRSADVYVARGANSNNIGFAFYTSNGAVPSEVVRIQPDGKVGIGTDSPQHELHVANASSPTIRIDDTGGDATNCSAWIEGRSGANDAWFVGMNTTSAAMLVNNKLNGPLVFGVNNAEKARIDSAGNFGIGTTSPQYTLDVNGDIYVRGQTIVFSSGGLSNMDYIQYNDGGITGLNTAGGYGFFADTTLSTDLTNASACIACKGLYSAGNVGINTSSPSTKLHIAGDTGTVPSLTADTQLVINNSSAAADNVTMSLIAGTSGTCTLYFGDSAAEVVGRISYSNSTSLLSMTYASVPDQLAFNSTGLKVGGTSTASEKLDVAGNIRASATETYYQNRVNWAATIGSYATSINAGANFTRFNMTGTTYVFQLPLILPKSGTIDQVSLYVAQSVGNTTTLALLRQDFASSTATSISSTTFSHTTATTVSLSSLAHSIDADSVYYLRITSAAATYTVDCYGTSVSVTNPVINSMR